MWWSIGGGIIIFALGIIWLCGGVIELFIALVRRSKEKKSK